MNRKVNQWGLRLFLGVGFLFGLNAVVGPHHALAELADGCDPGFKCPTFSGDPWLLHSEGKKVALISSGVVNAKRNAVLKFCETKKMEPYDYETKPFKQKGGLTLDNRSCAQLGLKCVGFTGIKCKLKDEGANACLQWVESLKVEVAKLSEKSDTLKKQLNEFIAAASENRKFDRKALETAIQDYDWSSRYLKSKGIPESLKMCYPDDPVTRVPPKQKKP